MARVIIAGHGHWRLMLHLSGVEVNGQRVATLKARLLVEVRWLVGGGGGGGSEGQQWSD